METIFGILLDLIVIVLAASGFLALIMVVTGAGYFFSRVLLKILGLHSATSEQFRNELRFAAICGRLILWTMFLVFILVLYDWFIGAD